MVLERCPHCGGGSVVRASRKTSFICEYCVEESPLRWDVTKQKMEIDADGFVHVPEGPGLGIDLNEDTIERDGK